MLEKAAKKGKKNFTLLLHYLMNFDQANEERSQELLWVEENKVLYFKKYFLQKVVASPSVRLNRERQFLLEFQKHCLNEPHPQYSEENATCSPSPLILARLSSFPFCSPQRQLTLGLSESDEDYVITTVFLGQLYL